MWRHAFFVLFLGLGLSHSAFAYTWGLNDVSVLFPIQDPNVLEALPAVDTRGAFGALLPPVVAAKIGKLQSFEDADTSFRSLRVVAFRIDPCFPSPTNLKLCRAQIRLVWQPIQIIRGSKVVGADAAVHTFYDLPPEEFRTLTGELRDARMNNESPGFRSDFPLAVNPILKRQGLAGSYFKTLRSIVLRHIGETRMSRATFTKLSSGFFVWDFGGFDIMNGRMLTMKIPRTGKPRQMFTNDVMPGETEFVSSAITPAPDKSGVNVNFISSDSKIVRSKDAAPLILSNVIDAANMENPRRFRAADLDCVSCHIAQSARMWATREFPKLDLAREVAKVAYRSPNHSMRNTSEVSQMTANVRHFGYFYQDAAISDRVIHESAEVADALNAGAPFIRRRTSHGR